MNAILLSGGAGKRLWPLSNEKTPKQFIKCIDNKSMLQRNYKLLKNLGYNISVTTTKEYEELIKKQIKKEITIINEPERRDTFAAICNSISYLYYNHIVNEDEYVAFLPVDAYVEKSFYLQLEFLEDILKKEKSDIGLIGITTTKASPNYGYICTNGDGDYAKIDKFIEKPVIKEAEKLIKNGAYINSGIFIVKVNYILRKIEKHIKCKNYEEFSEKYSKLPKISFDYEVLENEKNIIVYKNKYEWKDIGNWEELVELLKNKEQQNVYSTKDINTTIINQLNIPVVSIGNENLIIVTSKEGIIIFDRNNIDDVNKYLKGIDLKNNKHI